MTKTCPTFGSTFNTKNGRPARRESPLKVEFWIVSVQMSHIAAQCGIAEFYEW